jgi:hypothetical protein
MKGKVECPDCGNLPELQPGCKRCQERGLVPEQPERDYSIPRGTTSAKEQMGWDPMGRPNKAESIRTRGA